MRNCSLLFSLTKIVDAIVKFQLIASLLLFPMLSYAAISFTGATYSQDFNSLPSSGTGLTWANDSTLAGWFLFKQSPVAAITQYNVDNGTVNTGKFYSFGVANATDRALGGLGSGGDYFDRPTSGSVAGWIAFAATNKTGVTVENITISFDGEQWRDGGNSTLATQTTVLEYGIGTNFSDVTTWIAPGGNFNWDSPVFVSTSAGVAVDGNVAGLSSNHGGTLSGLNWAANDTLWIRWIENNDVGNDHALAIDNFSISIPPITPTVNLSLSTNTSTESGATTITVTATSSSVVSSDQTVNLNVSGTGITAADYTLSHATITIPNGNTTGSVTFAIVDDTTVEGNETAILTISNPSSGISLGTTSTQNITITDNDTTIPANSTPSYTAPSYTVIVQTTGTGAGKVAQTAEFSNSYMPKIKLTAIPDNGSQFVRWSERFAPECVGTNPIVTVTVNAIKTCIATFDKIPMKNQTINFAPLPVKTLDNADFAVEATATSGLPVTISSVTPNMCLINNGMLHLVNVGTCTLMAQQSGNSNYFAASPVSQSFLINPIDSNTQLPDNSTTGATKPRPSSQLRGVSANAMVGKQPVIVGILTTDKQRVLVRASALDDVIDPEVVVLSYPDRKVLASNDNWNTGATAEELRLQQLAPEHRTDAAMIVELPAGLFTVEMISHQSVIGMGLLELYDITVFSPELSQNATIQGISVNAFFGDFPTIAGLLITGNPKRMLVRASGIDETDPDVAIFSYPDRKLLANNAQWLTTPAAAELTQKHLTPARPTDAAMIVELPPGLLTVEMERNPLSTTGRSIIEVYDLNVFP